jgi:hypothetical protein
MGCCPIEPRRVLEYLARRKLNVVCVASVIGAVAPIADVCAGVLEDFLPGFADLPFLTGLLG